MKEINTGGLSFAELRERNKYYVDKTLLIKDILDTDDCGVYLFTPQIRQDYEPQHAGCIL